MLNHNYLWRMTEWGSIPWWRPRAPPRSHSCTDRPSPSWVPAHQTRHNTGRPSQMPELRWGRTPQCWGQNCLWPPPQRAHRHRPQVYFPPRGQSDQQWRGSGTAWTLPDSSGPHSSSSQGSDQMWGNVPAFFLLAQTVKMVVCQITKSSIQTFFFSSEFIFGYFSVLHSQDLISVVNIFVVFGYHWAQCYYILQLH